VNRCWRYWSFFGGSGLGGCDPAPANENQLTLLDFVSESFRCPQFAGFLEPAAKPNQFSSVKTLSTPRSADRSDIYAQIKDWKQHLEVIASFWETIIGGPSTYARPIPIKHLTLRLREEDFERWLFLWQANCRAQLPSDVAKEMIDLADHIAHRLRTILGVPNN